MKKLVNMNEYFQCPDKLITDAEYVINWFCDDKIDIYIPGKYLQYSKIIKKLSYIFLDLLK